MRKTNLIFIIDSSGSMSSLQNDTIGGFNGLIEEHRRSETPTVVTTVTFDSVPHVLYDGVDVMEAPLLTQETYRPGGFTAFLDAVGETIELVQNRTDNTPAENRPDQTLCVIITDGQENRSQKYTKPQIKQMIHHQENGHGWKFMFLGANMDAVAEATSYGIGTAATYTASEVGTRTVFDTLVCASKGYVTDGALASDWDASLTGDSSAEMNSIATAIDAAGTHTDADTLDMTGGYVDTTISVANREHDPFYYTLADSTDD